MKKIKVKLSLASLEEAQRQLKEYQESINKKLEQFVRVLANDGVSVVRAQLAQMEGDSNYDGFGAEVDANGDIVKAYVYLHGHDAIFIEFGAGIYYNNGNNHPLAAELGYSIGSYPSESGYNRAINPGYWWYKNEYGHLSLSLGTKSVRPVYEAAQNVRNTAIMKAISVFRD